jgi:2,4-dienoyl-CoA reductase-like NADH-dependent reductase (Old Yellow Enzyme family)
MAESDEEARLTPEAARALLRECVTVVRPGETLVVRAPDWWTPEQVAEYQRYANAATADGGSPFKVLVVLGQELAVVQPEPKVELVVQPGSLSDDEFARRIEALLPAVLDSAVRKAARL